MPIRARKFFRRSEAGILRIVMKELKPTGGWAYLPGRLKGTVHFALIPTSPVTPAPPMCPLPEHLPGRCFCATSLHGDGEGEKPGKQEGAGERATAGQQQQVTMGPATTISSAEGGAGPAMGITGSSLKAFSSSGPQFPSWKQR